MAEQPSQHVVVRPGTQTSAGLLNRSCSRNSVTVHVLPNPASATNTTRESTPMRVQHQHSYRVKIINPLKKSEVIVRDLHHFNGRFDSVITLRAKLIEELKEQVPESVTFSVSYFEGSQHSKVWLVTHDDLRAMCMKYPRGLITLWCDSRNEPEVNVSVGEQPNVRGMRQTRHQEKEDEVQDIYQDLRQKHADKYSTPQLRLWAWMVSSNLHEDLDSPPDIPAFCGSTSKRSRQQQSLSDALSGAAVAIVKALSNESKTKANDSVVTQTQFPTGASISPAKSVELRMKNLEQLRYLQQLFDDNVLTKEEYTEQKQSILSSLRKL